MFQEFKFLKEDNSNFKEKRICDIDQWESKILRYNILETRSTKGSHYKLRPYLIQRGGGDLWLYLVETMLDVIVHMLSIVLFYVWFLIKFSIDFHKH